MPTKKEVVYGWKPASLRSSVARKHDPQIVGTHLEKLRQERGGYISPEDVVKNATNKKSPIHTCFTWDDQQAARQRRLEEARWLLRNLTVTRVYVNHKIIETEPQRVFVVVGNEENEQFTSIDDAMSKESEREQLIARALAELRAWRNRYGNLKELAKICGFIDDQLERIR